MEPKVKVGRISLPMDDPTFDYDTIHTAHIPVANPTPESWTYNLVLFLATTEGGAA